MEMINDLNKENEKQNLEVEESPFYSLIIKDLNDYYIRYDVSFLYLDNKFKSCVWYKNFFVGYTNSELYYKL